MIGIQGLQRKIRLHVEGGDRRRPESVNVVCNELRGFSKQIAMLAPDRTPDERAVPLIELFDSAGRFDHFGS